MKIEDEIIPNFNGCQKYEIPPACWQAGLALKNQILFKFYSNEIN
jgi:hypothetical protein